MDGVLNFLPGLAMGLVLGWSTPTAVLLGGVTWISSSGVISKVLSDLDRLGNRETPAILNLLVIEDLAMAIYLPVVAAVVIGDDAATTASTVVLALSVVALLLWAGSTFGSDLSRGLSKGSNEALLLGVFGITLVVGGLAQQVDVSAAVGAFMVGLALSGPAQQRATALIEPLRDLFAAIFFLGFSFQIDPSDLPPVLIPAVVLGAVTAATKLGSGWIAARRIGVGVAGRFRAGATLVARGEFSIVIAALGATLADGTELGALAGAYVLLTAIAGPLAAKYADQLVPRRLLPRPTP
jgi:CPA2 family monovalent cation:H+ antiporter-2